MFRTPRLSSQSSMMPMGHQKNTKDTVLVSFAFFGDSWENRTPVSALRGPCLSRLTNEPYSFFRVRLTIIQQRGHFVNSFLQNSKKNFLRACKTLFITSIWAVCSQFWFDLLYLFRKFIKYVLYLRARGGKIIMDYYVRW